MATSIVINPWNISLIKFSKGGFEMYGLFYLIIVLGLVVLFFVSFFLFIKRVLRSSAVRESDSLKNGEELHIIIKQNEKIISLLEEK